MIGEAGIEKKEIEVFLRKRTKTREKERREGFKGGLKKKKRHLEKKSVRLSEMR